ncbi:hypothetical protein DL98DRAFT_621194, partial [Cadophora sp. DSE1049]
MSGPLSESTAPSGSATSKLPLFRAVLLNASLSSPISNSAALFISAIFAAIFPFRMEFLLPLTSLTYYNREERFNTFLRPLQEEPRYALRPSTTPRYLTREGGLGYSSLGSSNNRNYLQARPSPLARG